MTRIALAVVALTLVTAGCNGSGSGEGSGGGEKAGAKAVTGSFVGNVDGTDAYVGIVVARDGDVFGYATDGVTNPDHLDGALGGRRDDSARLGNDGGAVLEAAFEGSTVTGTYTRPGYEPWTFEQRPLGRGIGRRGVGDLVGLDRRELAGAQRGLGLGERLEAGRLSSCQARRDEPAPGFIDPATDLEL